MVDAWLILSWYLVAGSFSHFPGASCSAGVLPESRKYGAEHLGISGVDLHGTLRAHGWRQLEGLFGSPEPLKVSVQTEDFAAWQLI